MSSRPRYFVIKATRFDGITSFDPATLLPVTANGNGEAMSLPSSNEPRLWAEKEGLVGRFSYQSLLRNGNQGALIRIRCIQPPDVGAIWQFRSASSTESTTPDGIDEALAPTHNLTQAWSAPFEAGPTDAIAVTFNPDSDEDPQIEIEVRDMDADTNLAWLEGGGSGSGSDADCCNFDSVTMTATGTVPSYNGTLLVSLTPAADATITLPAIDSIDVNSKIIFVRKSGNGLPTIVPDDAADEVNGSIDTELTRYFMRSASESVTYTRVPSGWQREQGTGVFELEAATGVGPFLVRGQYEGTQYVVSTMAAGAIVQLPAIADCRAGYRVVVFNSNAANANIIQADGAEFIDGQPTDGSGLPYPLPQRAVVILENNGTQWVTVTSDPSPAATSSAISVALAAWRSIGTQIITMTAGATTLTLPPVADLAPRARVLVFNSSTGLVTVQGDAGAETINGAATRSVWQGQACLLTNTGTVWQAVGGVNQPANIVDDSDPLPIPAWVDSPQYVQTGAAVQQTVQLPSAALVAQGAELIHFNAAAATAHEIAPAGAEFINGLNAPFAVAAGERVIVKRVSSTEWITVLSA